MTLKDSKIDRAWLQRAMQAYPPMKLENGNVFSGPVRLAFVNLFNRGKPQDRDDGTKGEGKYGTTLLFPPSPENPAYMNPLYQAWHEEAMRTWSDRWDPTQNKFQGIEWPFHDQGKKAFGSNALSGYESGSMYLNISSNYKPPVVDPAMNPIVAEDRVYAGVWAVVVMNTYGFGRNPPRPKKGAGFGVQCVTIIGDDQKLGGGAPDPKAAFKGVDLGGLVQTFDPQKQFGGMPTGGFQGPQGGMPIQPLPGGGGFTTQPAQPSEADVLAKLMG